MEKTANKIGVKFGLILAAYYVIFDCVLFFIDQSLFTNIYLGFLNISITVLLAITCIVLAKKAFGGYVTFKEAFTPYLIFILIGVTTNMLTYYILFTLIDPSAQIAIRDSLYQTAVETINALGMPEEDRLQKIAQAKDSNPFTFQGQIFSWAGSILKYCILGFLLAAIFKNKSEFFPIQAQDPTTPSPKN